MVGICEIIVCVYCVSMCDVLGCFYGWNCLLDCKIYYWYYGY